HAAGSFEDHRRASLTNGGAQVLLRDLPLAEVCMSVRPGTLRIAGVVGVHQVDPASGAADAFGETVQLFTRGPRVAGVEAEADLDAVLTRKHLGPRFRDPLRPAGDGAVAAGSVFDEDGYSHLDGVERLAPIVIPDGHIGISHMPAVNNEAEGIDLGGE